MPGRFFPGASDPRVAAILYERCPDSAPRIVAAADRTLQKRFDLLGYRELSFGDPIDWHLDPVARRRAPLLHWTLLDPLDAATVGDSKVVWELSRHQWLVRLGQAYRLTSDERYADAFADTIRDWRRANPPGMGINWTSSLEAAFRLISWCWSLSLFRGSAALTPQLRADLVEGIAGHASRIERYLSHYFSPNTHLTGEALGLFYAGTLFPLLPGASRWRQRAARHPDPGSRSPDPSRRRVHGAVDVLPELHGRDLPPLRNARLAESAFRFPTAWSGAWRACSTLSSPSAVRTAPCPRSVTPMVAGSCHSSRDRPGMRAESSRLRPPS